MITKRPAVYLMANHKQGALYVGVTSDLPRRVAEHKASVTGGFTAQYACKTLVWFEMHDEMTAAITREKQIKGGSRKKKIELIEVQNPDWRDLYLDLF